MTAQNKTKIKQKSCKTDTYTHKYTQRDNFYCLFICWSATPEHEICLGVIGLYSIALLEKTDFPSRKHKW